MVGHLNRSLSEQLDVDCHLFACLFLLLDADSNPLSHEYISETRREYSPTLIQKIIETILIDVDHPRFNHHTFDNHYPQFC